MCTCEWVVTSLVVVVVVVVAVVVNDRYEASSGQHSVTQNYSEDGHWFDSSQYVSD